MRVKVCENQVFAAPHVFATAAPSLFTTWIRIYLKPHPGSPTVRLYVVHNVVAQRQHDHVGFPRRTQPAQRLLGAGSLRL
jgi:hypothetical protein